MYLYLYNQYGNATSIVTGQRQSIGEQLVVLPSDKFPAGSYLCILKIGDRTYNSRLVILP